MDLKEAKQYLADHSMRNISDLGGMENRMPPELTAAIRAMLAKRNSDIQEIVWRAMVTKLGPEGALELTEFMASNEAMFDRFNQVGPVIAAELARLMPRIYEEEGILKLIEELQGGQHGDM